MPLTPVALSNRALVKLAALPVAAFDEGTVEATVAATLYPPARDAMLSAYPWSFATAQAALPRLQAPPLADFAHAYALPADFLRALSVGTGSSGRGQRYRIAGARLHADADEVTLSYIYRPDESAFPAFFAAALTARLAAEFCIPLTENTSRAEALLAIAEDEFRRVKLTDAQQDTPPAIEDFTLIGVRGR
jgi:hypothetical protein